MSALEMFREGSPDVASGALGIAPRTHVFADELARVATEGVDTGGHVLGEGDDVAVSRGEADPDRTAERLRPLSRERRLAVPRGREEEDHTRVALIEHLDQPRPLDD